jgi:hypothetical protein
MWQVLERQGLGLLDRVVRNVLGVIALEAGERSTVVQVLNIDGISHSSGGQRICMRCTDDDQPSCPSL